MHKVLADEVRTLLSLSTEELAAVTHAVRYASERAQLTEEEYTAAFGVGPGTMLGLHTVLCAEPPESRRTSELIEAWEDHGTVMVRVMNCFGDPVEFGEREISQFSERLQQAISNS
jgi:hypothetical protein